MAVRKWRRRTEEWASDGRQAREREEGRGKEWKGRVGNVNGGVMVRSEVGRKGIKGCKLRVGIE